MDLNFCRILLEKEKAFPNKEILHILIDGKYKSLSYKKIIDGARKFEEGLKKAGIGNGDVVILILPHGLDLIYSYFGAILNGCIPSIMPYLTEKLIPEKYRKDLHSLIAITKPIGLITFADFKREIRLLNTIETSIKSILISEEINCELKILNDNHFGLLQKSTDIALLQHSSGTTGLQKGVALSHQAVINQLSCYEKALKIKSDDVIVSWLPLYHDMGLIAGFLLPILYGIPLVIMSPFEWVRAPYKILKAISEFRGTLCWMPNFAFNFCAKKIRNRDIEGLNLEFLRAIINCSEPMRLNSHKLFLERFMPYGLNQNAIATCYAMAENVFAVTQGGIDQPVVYDEIDLISFQESNLAKPVKNGEKSVVMVSAGKCLSNTKIKIIDSEGKEKADRELGEIILKSDCMLSGYYNRVLDTSNAFVDGWFKTGDLGYIANSELFISGRKKDLIIVGGKNIYPKDIETIAMEIKGVHPGRVVAFGLYNEQKGTEDVVIIAEVNDDFLDKKDIVSDNIRKKVTSDSAIALRNVLIVDKSWLIKTSSGKIARALNKEKYIRELN
jgi:fatty-acyl-CoA synthase